MANLITVDDYKILKGITTLKEDERLDVLITSVSQLVKTYCGNSFIDYFAVDKVEIFTISFDTSFVQLTESPVRTITSVEERPGYSSAYVALTTGAFEYYLDLDTDTVYRTNSSGYINWTYGPGAVRVTYNAGWAEVPPDLKLAIVDLVTYYYKEEYKERRTIGAASIANQTTSSQWRNVDFPDHIKRVLDYYKQIQV